MNTWTVRATGGAQEIDLAEARRALAVLADPAHGCGFRGWPSERRLYGPGGDIDGLIRLVEELNDNKQIHVLLNPVRANFVPEPRKGAHVADILCRRWLLIDVDPRRPEGFQKDSATDGEHEAAKDCAFQIQQFLAEQDWPEAIEIDSGNGWYLLYKIDLPNDAHGRVLLGRLLKAICERFDSASVEIDRGVHAANIHAKLPGSWARKGPGTDHRPHRPCRLVYVPESIEQVRTGQIAELAGVSADAPRPEPKAAFRVRATGPGARAYAQAALKRECARMASAPHGFLNNQLFRSAACLGEFVPDGLLSESEIEEALLTAGRLAGCDNEVKDRDTIQRGIAQGKTQPRVIPDRPERNGQHKKEPPRDRTDEKVAPDQSVIVRASSITPRKVTWLWPWRIPQNKLTTFAGTGGLGKTFVLLDLTARITAGKEWPDIPGECADVGQVLFVSGEDDPDDTLVPRLIEMGADLNRVVFLKTEVQDRFTLADLKTLDLAISQAGGGVKMVAIDPPTAYLGGVDDHKNAELRGLLSPLKNWASRHEMAIIFNTHVNKPQGAKVEAMMRVVGSVAWVNVVRAAHMFAKDPADYTRRLFVGMKNNVGKERKGLAYRIVETETLARVEWLGEVDTTADEAVNKEKRKRDVKATEWLEELFQGTDRLASKAIYADMEELTKLSKDALHEGKDAMGIRAFQDRDSEGQRRWFWEWPAECRERWQARKQTGGDGPSMAEHGSPF